MDATILQVLLRWATKLGVGSTILIFVVLAAFSYAPELLEDFTNRNIIKGQETSIDVLQKMYFYNEYTLDGFNTILDRYPDKTEESTKLLAVSVQVKFKEGMNIAAAEMNRRPYCYPNTGTRVLELLDGDSLRMELIDIMSIPSYTKGDKLDYSEDILRSYQRRTVEMFSKDLAETPLCVN